MIRWFGDEGLDDRFVRGLLKRKRSLDLVRARDAGLAGWPDPEILTWAADQNRILLTTDRRTMTAAAFERVARGLALPGVFLIRPHVPMLTAIEVVLLIDGASTQEEWRDRVVYVPFHTGR